MRFVLSLFYLPHSYHISMNQSALISLSTLQGRPQNHPVMYVDVEFKKKEHIRSIAHMHAHEKRRSIFFFDDVLTEYAVLLLTIHCLHSSVDLSTQSEASFACVCGPSFLSCLFVILEKCQINAKME
jgi:hypothetical protein